MATEPGNSPESEQKQNYVVPKNVSTIRNECLNLCHDLNSLKQKIEESLNALDKNDEKVTVLNYKMYQIRYNYSEKIHELIDRKRQLESNKATESELSLSLVANEIEDCKNQHDVEHDATKRLMVEAQEEYEEKLGILDTTLDIMKSKLEHLFLLIEARKAGESSQELLHDTALISQLGEYEQFVDYYTEIQTVGWSRRKNVKVPTDVNGLRFTDEGLLVTESGNALSYEDAVNQNLLHNMHPIFSTMKLDITPERVASSSSATKTSSGSSRMSSEDVAYLKEQLGTPLTLALAEISAVQPRDPIHYLGHWLFKYRYNEEVDDLKRIEIEQLTAARDKLAKEKWHAFVEAEAKAAVEDMINRVEEEVIRNEFLRIERELEEEEEENLEDEARDKFVGFGGEESY